MEDETSTGLPDGKRSFPVSLRISRGPIAGPPLPEMITNSLPPGDFPANVTFVKGNYVLESDMLLQTQREEYDVILCLSVTKWVHLNWGDAGLKRLFQRVYKHLRPGGLFILEPQPWNSYGKRKKLTETIFKNYHSIRLKPDQFSSYLTTEVGFSSYELIGTSQNYSRGFQRPIYLFHKGPSPQKWWHQFNHQLWEENTRLDWILKTTSIWSHWNFKHFSLIVDFPYFELLNGISLVLNKRNCSPAIKNKGKPIAIFFKDSTEEFQMQISFPYWSKLFLPLIKNGLVNKHNVESNQITQSNF